jgi:hypothetical protein
MINHEFADHTLFIDTGIRNGQAIEQCVGCNKAAEKLVVL